MLKHLWKYTFLSLFSAILPFGMSLSGYETSSAIFKFQSSSSNFDIRTYIMSLHKDKSFPCGLIDGCISFKMNILAQRILQLNLKCWSDPPRQIRMYSYVCAICICVVYVRMCIFYFCSRTLGNDSSLFSRGFDKWIGAIKIKAIKTCSSWQPDNKVDTGYWTWLGLKIAE